MNDVDLWDNVSRTLFAEAAAIEKLTGTLRQENVLELIKLIAGCRGRIIVSGCGTSAAAARKVAHSLCCIERPACYLNPADAVHGALGLLQKEDVFVLISKGGNTAEIINMIPACRTKGATLVGVTENLDSTLAQQADLVLKIKVEQEPDDFNMLATASTLAVIAVFDAICIALMQYTQYSREQFAIIHPGGAVGTRLLQGEKRETHENDESSCL